MLAVPVLLCSVVLCPYSTIIIYHPYFHVPSFLFPSAHVFVPFSMQPCIFPWLYAHALIFFSSTPFFLLSQTYSYTEEKGGKEEQENKEKKLKKEETEVGREEQREKKRPRWEEENEMGRKDRSGKKGKRWT